MTRNSWKARVIYALALWLTGVVHHNLVQNVSNTPEGMFIYHASAAATDYLLLMCASSVLYGRLADDMQHMCLLSMVINFIGWVLYMAYAPPNTYNLAIGILSYVQYARLITLGIHGTDRIGQHFIRGHDPLGSKLHFEKA